MIDIAFLALAQAHQHLHWLPAALRLAREPGVRVYVLCPSWAGLKFIRGYDPQRTLRLRWMPASRTDGLFALPPRKRILKRYGWLIRRYPYVVTTESTSTALRRDPRFTSKMIRIRHGAGDRDSVFDPRIDLFDLTLVAGAKDKQKLLDVGHATDANCIVSGYAKFETVRPPQRLFGNDRPVVLYNPHFEPRLSSWLTHGEALVREMERLPEWNFVVAPHVKVEDGPDINSTAPNILIDCGSARSIDMTYTQAAAVYIGDVSSQTYEYLREPRPCIFVNAHGVAWRDDPAYANWHLGQVIDRPEQLGPALAQAAALQPQFEPLQRAAMDYAVEDSPVPSSERQAQAILAFIRADLAGQRA